VPLVKTVFVLPVRCRNRSAISAKYRC